MFSLLKTFFRITLLRDGPQALPASWTLLAALLVIHWLLGVALSAPTLPFPQAAGAALVGTLLVVALTQGALLLRSMKHRLVQTATALAGAELLLGLLALPVTAWYYSGGEALGASLLSLLLLGWSLAVTANIFRHALDAAPALAYASAVAYMLISYFVAGLLTGPGV